KLIQRFLEKMGHSVVLADDSEQAIILFEKTAFNLIFIDTKIQGIDGFSLTRSIREMEVSSGKSGWIPIIGMITRKGEEPKNECWESGMDDINEKPIKLEDLQKIVEKHFSKTEQ
ncbi:MAG TPA: response regulator, partial [Ignavibacteriaceae bacterium]